MTFSPKLNILPASQRALWKELKATPRHFVLYGGTALALRLGHRVSEDFDFSTNATFEPLELAGHILYGAENSDIIDGSSGSFDFFEEIQKSNRGLKQAHGSSRTAR